MLRVRNVIREGVIVLWVLEVMKRASTPYCRKVFVMSRTCSRSTQNTKVLRLSADISGFCLGCVPWALSNQARTVTSFAFVVFTTLIC